VAEETREQREVHYAGRVQGVGFRYTVRVVAAQFDVTGFVRNLPDGRVQLVAEGTPGEIERLLDAVRGEMGPYIRDAQETVRPASGGFRAFEIRH
jgi:acylphosphatase